MHIYRLILWPKTFIQVLCLEELCDIHILGNVSTYTLFQRGWFPDSILKCSVVALPACLVQWNLWSETVLLWHTVLSLMVETTWRYYSRMLGEEGSNVPAMETWTADSCWCLFSRTQNMGTLRKRVVVIPILHSSENSLFLWVFDQVESCCLQGPGICQGGRGD